MRINEYFLTFLKMKIISYTLLYRHDDILISLCPFNWSKSKKEFKDYIPYNIIFLDKEYT